MRSTAVAVLVALALGGLASCGSPAGEPAPSGAPADERQDERSRMTIEQIELRGVHDEAVLAAMRAVPRHRFVPEDVAEMAYADSPLPIGYRQTISQPFVVAYMTEALGLTGSEKVLEIGTGSGYQAAILAALVPEVWSIEIVAPLAERARETLRELGYTGVHVRTGDGYRGWPEEAPFDRILLTAAPERVPEPLLEQLAVGGRLVAPVGGIHQELVVIERTEAGYQRRTLLPVRFVPMTGEAEGRPR